MLQNSLINENGIKILLKSNEYKNAVIRKSSCLKPNATEEPYKQVFCNLLQPQEVLNKLRETSEDLRRLQTHLF